VRKIPVFDAHCDTISRTLKTKESLWLNSGMVSLAQTADHLQPYCQIYALFANSGRPGHATYEQLLKWFKQQMEENSGRVAHCRTADDVAPAVNQGKACAFLSVEGAELLDCSEEKLTQAAADGVIAINLTWNHANAISGSCREDPDRGLSDIGRSFVLKMGELGVLTDVSHLSDPGFWDVMELVQTPVIASHSNARAICPHVRNLTDSQITAIIEHQGIIGLNFYRDFVGLGEDFDAVRAHLDHMLDLGGSGTVALGGDWDGCDTIAALPTVAVLPELYEYFLAHNYSENLLTDLFYNNLMRVVREK